MAHKGLETALPLLVAYEVLSLAYKKGPNLRNQELVLENVGKKSPDSLPSVEYANYNQSFALAAINASMIEGIVRSILAQSIYEDYNQQILVEVEAGRTKASKPQMLLQKFLNDVEMQGGWEKLKKQFSFYFDISIDGAISEDVKEGLGALFVLRNVFAHGTTLIHPSQPMDDSMKTEYPFNWQCRLQRARVYLKKQFSHDDIFDNLAEHALPEHFLNISKTFFNELEALLGSFPSRAADIIGKLDRYKFGYVALSR